MWSACRIESPCSGITGFGVTLPQAAVASLLHRDAVTVGETKKCLKCCAGMK